MDLVGNDMDTLHEEMEYLVDHLVENDAETLHEEIIHLVGFSFIRVIDNDWIRLFLFQKKKNVYLQLVVTLTFRSPIRAAQCHSNL